MNAEHDRKAAKPVQVGRPDHAEPGQDDDDEGQLERHPQRQRHLDHETEVGVVGDERGDGFSLKAEQYPERLRHHEEVGDHHPGQKEGEADRRATAPGPAFPWRREPAPGKPRFARGGWVRRGRDQGGVRASRRS